MDLNQFDNSELIVEFQQYVNNDWTLASHLFLSVIRENQKLKDEINLMNKKLDDKDSEINYLVKQNNSIKKRNENLREEIYKMEELEQNLKLATSNLSKSDKTNNILNSKLKNQQTKIDHLEDYIDKIERRSNTYTQNDIALINKNRSTNKDDNKLLNNDINDNINDEFKKYKAKILVLDEKNKVLLKENLNLRNQIRVFNYGSKLNCVNSNKTNTIEQIHIQDLSKFRNNFKFK